MKSAKERRCSPRPGGETLDAEAAMELANSELHAMRRDRRAPKR